MAVPPSSLIVGTAAFLVYCTAYWLGSLIAGPGKNKKSFVVKRTYPEAPVTVEKENTAATVPVHPSLDVKASSFLAPVISSQSSTATTISTRPATKDNDRVSVTSDDGNNEWRRQARNAVDDIELQHQDFYAQLGANGSCESLNDVSYAQTPERFTLDVLETNAIGARRNIYVKYRPLRKWMDTKGAKGVALKMLSRLQIAAHWGLTVGPYTYDVFQSRREIIMHVGEWRLMKPGEKSRVKTRVVGYTYMTDMKINEMAKLVYTRMRPQGYDHHTNNCHRFANDLAERIVPVYELQTVTLRMRLLWIWNSLPASHLFHTGELLKQFVRMPKALIQRLKSEMHGYGLLDSEGWRMLMYEGRVAARSVFFLLTVGAMTMFLNMARALTMWDPNDPVHRARYLEFFDYIPGVSGDMARAYLKWAFQGPQTLVNIPNELQTHARGKRDLLMASLEHLRGAKY